MAAVVFEDLSGTATPVSESDNPYQPLIDSANDDPVCEPLPDIQSMGIIVDKYIDRNTNPLHNPPYHQNWHAKV